jgi:hypothetical protein
VALLWGCGTTCDRVAAADARFFAGAMQCASLSASDTVTVRRRLAGASQCNARLPKCTPADLQRLDAYARCLEAAPACLGGNERAAAEAYTRCDIERLIVTEPNTGQALTFECEAGFR